MGSTAAERRFDQLVDLRILSNSNERSPVAKASVLANPYLKDVCERTPNFAIAVASARGSSHSTIDVNQFNLVSRNDHLSESITSRPFTTDEVRRRLNDL